MTDLDNPGATDEAATWSSWCKAQAQDACLFVRLLAAMQGRMAAAVILWDLMAYHRRAGLDAWLTRSAAALIRTYGPAAGSERALREALMVLRERDWVTVRPSVRNVARSARLNWPCVHQALAAIDARTPGLDPHRA